MSEMTEPVKIMIVVGARPNMMKAAPIIWQVSQYPGIFSFLLVDTGQHYDEVMNRIFYKELGLPPFDYYLGVGSGSHAGQTAKVLVRFERILKKENPALVIVVGDINSTLACALTAAKLGIRIAHVEAGLRSFDRRMPEEINRVLTDVLSDFLFITCSDARKNLLREGVASEKIFFVGNVMIDTLLALKKKARTRSVLKDYDLKKRKYAVATLHRPENVDDQKILLDILEGLKEVSAFIPVVFPAHPRTMKQIRKFGFRRFFDEQFRLIDALGYLDFLSLTMHAKMILTDSGGIQEEATVLGVPCLTLRENTERPITIARGTNVLVGTQKKAMVAAARRAWSSKKISKRVPALWDGKAAERIVGVLKGLGK